MQQLIRFVLPIQQFYRCKLKANAATSKGVAVMTGSETGLDCERAARAPSAVRHAHNIQQHIYALEH